MTPDETLLHCSGSSHSVFFCHDNKPGATKSRCLRYHHVLERGTKLLDLRCEACIKDARTSHASTQH